MADTINIGVIGCMGRMGQAIIEAVRARSGMRVVAGSDMPGHPGIGMTIPGTDVVAGDGVAAVFAASDVVIDFTPPGNTAAHAALAADTGTSLIIGTTGLDDAAHAAIDEAAKSVAICQAGNFSLGVNVLAAVTQKIASMLPAEDWDVEIVEMHHKHKVDAPSGTAVMLGEAAAKGRGQNLDEHAVHARDGVIGEREAGEIGFATLRGGSVIGEHDVIFASGSERLTFGHKAENRGLFAGGAVTAARWVAGKDAGRYTMFDVLGI